MTDEPSDEIWSDSRPAGRCFDITCSKSLTEEDPYILINKYLYNFAWMDVYKYVYTVLSHVWG
jgi:hypothetical protein